MQEYRKDEIIYEEDWQRFDEPYKADIVEKEYTKAEIKSDPENTKEKRPVSLITIQLVLCLIIAFVLFMLKAMASETYEKLSDWYRDQMRNTIVSSKKFEDIDLSEYLPSTDDELSATIDES